jgi:hypothetical protein
MGLHTIQRRKLTGKGIKPQGKVQWDFVYLWLYGVVEPQTGEGFFYEFTHLDEPCVLRSFWSYLPPLIQMMVVLHSNDNQAFCSLDKLALYS